MDDVFEQLKDPESQIYKEHGSVRNKPVTFTETGEPKQCYYNAQTYVLDHDATYVEGIVIAHGIPVKHAWVETDNELLELTLPADTPVKQYYGCEYSLETVSERLVELEKAYPLAGRHNNHTKPIQNE